MSGQSPLILLGVGQVARAIVLACGGDRKITGTTRDPRKIFEFVERGITPLIMPLPSLEVLSSIAEGANIVVSFPPDGETDSILAPVGKIAKRVIYISSTGVYGAINGTVDDTTPPDDSGEKLESRLQAESAWQEYGAIVLRAPGIYGPESGLHLSLRNGKYKLPGDGKRYTSRIHVDDLAAVILKMLDTPNLMRNCYVICDDSPCTQLEIVTWLCDKLGIPLPESVPLDQVHRTLRGNRRVDATGLLTELNFQLKYPHYSDGYNSLLTLPVEQTS